MRGMGTKWQQDRSASSRRLAFVTNLYGRMTTRTPWPSFLIDCRSSPTPLS